jgi:hypothetical protein
MWAQSCSFPPSSHPLRCHATEDHGCAPPLKPSSRATILLQLKQSTVTRAPHHRLQLPKFSPRAGMAHHSPSLLLSAPGKWPSGQAHPQRQETGSRHNSVEVVWGVAPLSLGAQQPQLHPPQLEGREGSGDDYHECGSIPERQAVCQPRASYKAMLMGQSCSIYHREERQPQPGEVFSSSRVPPSKEEQEGWQLVKPRRMCPWSMKHLEDVL